MATKGIPSVPDVPAQLTEDDIYRILEPLKRIIDIRQGRFDPLDRWVTQQDLIDAGLQTEGAASSPVVVVPSTQQYPFTLSGDIAGGPTTMGTGSATDMATIINLPNVVVIDGGDSTSTFPGETTGPYGVVTGGGGIGGAITDNQIAVGAATADDIEGSTELTFNSATNVLQIGENGRFHLGNGNERIQWANAGNGSITIYQDSQPTIDISGTNDITMQWGNLTVGSTVATNGVVSIRSSGSTSQILDFYLGTTKQSEIRMNATTADLEIRTQVAGREVAVFSDLGFEAMRWKGTNGDTEMGGYLTLYNGTTPSDGQVLTWVSANGRAEFGAAGSPGGSNLQLQYNDNGSFNGSSFCYFDLSGTSGQNPTLFLDASDPTTFWRNPRLRLVHDQHDVSHIEFYEELVRKADIRYESLSAGALDSLHIQNFTNAQSGSTTTGAIYLTVRTSGGSNQSKLRANQYGVEILNGNIRLYARSSASYPDSTTTGQIYINNGDNLLYFRDGSGTEYDLTGATAPTATTVQGNDPYIGWIEDDAALDQGYWRLIADGEALIGRIYDDIETNSYDWLTVNRSGTGTGVQVDTLDFTAATDITFNALTKVEGINPEFELSETGVATDQGIWLFEAETETLYGRLRDDAASNLTDWLTVTRSGTGASMVTDKITLKATDISLDGNPSIGDGSELTIATGSITPTTGFHLVDTEADAATDDLTTISGGTTGQILVLKSVVDSRNVVVKDGTNIALASSTDFTLENADDSITLLYTGTKWIELSRSTNV